MELSIPSSSVKEFTAILKTFKSFSDFIHIHPLPARLKFSAVSPTRSTYAVAIFERTFFESYVLSNPTLGLIEVALKPLHKIFAQSNLMSALESCKISIDSDQANESLSISRRPSGVNGGGGGGQTGGQRLNHRLTIKLKSTVGIIRSFSLPYSNSRTLNPTDLRANNSPNRWVCLSSHLKQWLDHFVSNPNITQNLVGALDGIEDICFCYLPDRQILIKTVNLADEYTSNIIVPKKQDIFTKGVRQLATSLTVNSSEFEKYEVEGRGGPIMTTMAIKEVRSIIELGSVLGSAVDAGFSVGGRPVYFSVLNEEGCVGLEFVLASTDGEESGPLEPAKEAARRSTDRAPGRRPIPIKGKQPAASTSSSSRVDSSARSSIHLNSPRPPTKNPPAGIHPKPQKLFKPAEEVEEEEDEEDELDRMPADAWAQVEQDAIALSQNRKRQRLSLSHSAIVDDDDDDEQLLPSQAPQNPNEQPHWKLFFD
ncbi:uncharacterized protein PGTG_15421 [Puccinia graminis f. sp. tritici CRL 75-36-700-3]|uniref:DNA repair protein rad9 n=1 Tax=Puccinia graminis f. sp. tritici (strain CRL 75-36-700-3 / race SCCL) TaxID=418459 RepID=E3KZP0_PUCGT|nr:uncharacterized protein PGTG_15421 [Puccinia graminis f. sp. tritici CRL 75-36-700-3]EFP89765.2 hypothetical protein PGTG_15421 [Puccinia graminis f. sp. tritici CRL 75-36-700-3]